MPVGGARAVAVNGDRVLLGSGYLKQTMQDSVRSDDPTALATMNLWFEQFKVRAAQPELFLLDLPTMAVEPLVALKPSGQPIGRSSFYGRGDRLYVVTDEDELLTIAVSEI